MATNPRAAGLIDPGPIEFDAELERSESSGAACFVPFPRDLKATYGKGNLIPIIATFDDRVEYRGSLAYMGGDCALLLVRKDKLAQIGKDAGETVHVQVELDTTPREIKLPDDAQSALDASDVAVVTWERLSYSHRREYAMWIEGAKKAETRVRRIVKMVELLADGKPLK